VWKTGRSLQNQSRKKSLHELSRTQPLDKARGIWQGMISGELRVRCWVKSTEVHRGIKHALHWHQYMDGEKNRQYESTDMEITYRISKLEKKYAVKCFEDMPQRDIFVDLLRIMCKKSYEEPHYRTQF
jgi:hypothetical protein